MGGKLGDILHEIDIANLDYDSEWGDRDQYRQELAKILLAIAEVYYENNLISQEDLSIKTTNQVLEKLKKIDPDHVVMQKVAEKLTYNEEDQELAKVLLAIAKVYNEQGLIEEDVLNGTPSEVILKLKEIDPDPAVMQMVAEKLTYNEEDPVADAAVMRNLHVEFAVQLQDAQVNVMEELLDKCNKKPDEDPVVMERLLDKCNKEPVADPVVMKKLHDELVNKLEELEKDPHVNNEEAAKIRAKDAMKEFLDECSEELKSAAWINDGSLNDVVTDFKKPVPEKKSSKEDLKLKLPSRYLALCKAFGNGYDFVTPNFPVTIIFEGPDGKETIEQITEQNAMSEYQDAERGIIHYHEEVAMKICKTDQEAVEASLKYFDAVIEAQKQEGTPASAKLLWKRGRVLSPSDISAAYIDNEILLNRLDSLIEKIEKSGEDVPVKLYFERAKQRAKLDLEGVRNRENIREAMSDLSIAYKLDRGNPQRDPLFINELEDVYMSLRRKAANQVDKRDLMESVREIRDKEIKEIMRIIGDTEAKAHQLDESYKNKGTNKMVGSEPNQKLYYTDYCGDDDNKSIGEDFKVLHENLQNLLYGIDLDERLQQSGIDSKSWLTKLKNIHYIAKKTEASKNREVWNKWQTSDHYDVKHKKDYFEGDNANLNNTFRGGAIKFFIARGYDSNPLNLVNDSSTFGHYMIKKPVQRIICTAIFLLIAPPIIAVVAVALAIPAIVVGAIEKGVSLANNKPAQTVETTFASEVMEADNPRSSTGNDIAVPIIESPSNEERKILQTIERSNRRHDDMMEDIRAYRSRAGETKFPTSKVDDTKHQMERFAGSEYRRLSTIEEEEERESLDQQTGPHAGQKEGIDDLAPPDCKF